MPIASHQYTVKTAKCFYATETQEQQRSQNRKFWNRIKLKIYQSQSKFPLYLCL